MKKILLLLLSTIAMYGQVPADATPLENVQITNNVQDNTATKVTVQTDEGVQNFIPMTSLPVSTSTQTAIDAKVGDFINDGATTIAPSMNAVYDALQLKENISNKATDFTTVNNNLYPTTKAISDATVYKTTIAQIRAFTGFLPNTNFYTTDKGQEGNWYYDPTDTTSADNTGTILVTSDGKRIKRYVSSSLELNWFDVKGDGVSSDTDAVVKALRVSETLNIKLKVKKGNYNLSTLTTQEYTYVNIEGEDKYSCVFLGAFDNYSRVPFITLGTGATLVNKGISLQGFDSTHYSIKHVKSVTIYDCFFKDNRYAAYLGGAITVYPESKIDYINIYDNVILDSPGFMMRCGVVHSANFTNNKFTNVHRNLTYYPLIVNKAMPLFGIAIGDGDDLDPSTGQDLSNRIIVTGNIIDGMYNNSLPQTGGYYTTNPIAVYGRKVIISNNVITDTKSDAITDCEGIYTKMVEGIISNNIVTNCGTIHNASGAIAIKGASDFDINENPVLIPKAKYIKVFGNIISNDINSYPSFSGINTYGGSDIEIYNNTIRNQGAVGKLGTGIYMSGNTLNTGVNRVSVHDNIISEIYGDLGIAVIPGFINDLSIKNNKISNILGASSLLPAYAIRIRASSSYINKLDVSGNIFYQDNVDNTMFSSIRFIEIGPTTTASDVILDNNHINIKNNSFSNGALVIGLNIIKGSGIFNNTTITNFSFSGAVSSSVFRPFLFNNAISLLSQENWLNRTVFLNQKLNNTTIDFLYTRSNATDSNYSVGKLEDYITLPVITGNRSIFVPNTDILNRTIRIKNTNTSGSNWAFSNSNVRTPYNTAAGNIPNESLTTIYFDGQNWITQSILSLYGTPAVTDKDQVFTNVNTYSKSPLVPNGVVQNAAVNKQQLDTKQDNLINPITGVVDVGTIPISNEFGTLSNSRIKQEGSDIKLNTNTTVSQNFITTPRLILSAVPNTTTFPDQILTRRPIEGGQGLGSIETINALGLPISTATQTALDLKANLASPTFTGNPTAPTAAPGTNTTQIATTAFVTGVARPYKVYTALLSQSGTSAPIATVLQNTLDGTVVWSYVSTGKYEATLTGAFTVNKTVTFVNQGATTPMAEVKFNRQDVNICTLRTYEVNTTTPTDTNMANDVSMVEIRVYN